MFSTDGQDVAMDTSNLRYLFLCVGQTDQSNIKVLVFGVDSEITMVRQYEIKRSDL